MTADELARQAIAAARRGGKPFTWENMVRGEIDPVEWEAFMRRRLAAAPPLPADQLAGIFDSSAPALPRSVDGWTLPADPELDELLEG